VRTKSKFRSSFEVVPHIFTTVRSFEVVAETPACCVLRQLAL
jgi:hypothetical protein